MKYLILPLVLATTAGVTGSALAQAPLPANQRYCLEVRDATGPHPLLCRFDSMAQCAASRTWAGDHCMINPVIAFQQRRR